MPGQGGVDLRGVRAELLPWRDMKQILDLRPIYHRLEERIRAHVVLCWLALLLIRIVETLDQRLQPG